LEYWNIGIVGKTRKAKPNLFTHFELVKPTIYILPVHVSVHHSIIPFFQHSIFSLFHHSIPSFHYDFISIISPFYSFSPHHSIPLLSHLFHHSNIPSVCSIIPVERCLPTGHLFAFVEAIQSISTIGFRPCNGARLTLDILPSIFGLLACSLHSRNGIPHTSQEQYSNGSDTPLDSSGSNLFTPLNMNLPAPISMPHLK
jgi:hypothetical protein